MVRNAIFLKIAVLYVVFSKFSKFLAGQFFYKQNSYKKNFLRKVGVLQYIAFTKKNQNKRQALTSLLSNLPTEFLKPNLKFSKFVVIYEV